MEPQNRRIDVRIDEVAQPPPQVDSANQVRLRSHRAARRPITFEGGPGDSVATAVVIRGAKGGEDGVEAEYEYLVLNFGQVGSDVQLTAQSLMIVNDRHYDVLMIRPNGGPSQEVFFDISDFYGK